MSAPVLSTASVCIRRTRRNTTRAVSPEHVPEEKFPDAEQEIWRCQKNEIFNKMNWTSAGDTGYQRDITGGESFGTDTRE